VRCSGTFDHSKEILLGPRTKDNTLGYHVITPLIREAGAGSILVNRGFVPREKIEQSTRPDSLASPFRAGPVFQ
jgi:surfeit locus 1 family protein